MKTETALITGAGSGIGRALAVEFAKQGHSLILTSRVESELRDLAMELSSQHGIHAGIIAADLEDPDAPQKIFEAVQRDFARVDILVNNAGLGFWGKFWEIPLEKQLPSCG